MTEDRLGDHRQGSDPILEVADLRVTYDAGAASVHALRGVTHELSEGERQRAIEVALSFVGLGDPVRRSWGSMIRVDRRSPGAGRG